MSFRVLLIKSPCFFSGTNAFKFSGVTFTANPNNVTLDEIIIPGVRREEGWIIGWGGMEGARA